MKILENLINEREELTTTMQDICTRAADEQRDLTEEELANVEDCQERAETLDTSIKQLRTVKDGNLEAAKMAAEVAAMGSDEAPQNRAVITDAVHVTNEPLTYEERSEHSFFADMYKAQVLNDPTAQVRQQRHMQEMDIEHRDSSSSNFAGLVVPNYLTNLPAPLASAGSPNIQNSRRLNLPPSGLTVNVSRITTGTTVAAQSAENAALSESTPDDTLLTVNVNSYGGFTDISRQAIDRGTGVDEIVVQDLALAYATSVNGDCIAGSGSSGTHLGILNTSGIGDIDIDDASPTAGETFQQIVKAIGTVNADRKSVV